MGNRNQLREFEIQARKFEEHVVLDELVARVVDFMERNLPADRLQYVAIRLPALALVL